MSETDIKANKVLSVIKPILESIVMVSGRDIPWGKAGVPDRTQVDALLASGMEKPGQKLRTYYFILSNLRNQASDSIRWGKGDIPELEYMDSTLAGLYAFLSEFVLKFE